MAAITFTDSIGAATLRNLAADGSTANAQALGGRFASWVPRTRPVTDVAESLATGARTAFTVRTDYGAEVVLKDIWAHKTSGGIFLVEIADRLVAHLLGGGTCSVQTEDNASATYATCGLWPGTEPQLVAQDAGLLMYQFSAVFLNLAGSPVRMTCRYGRT